MVLAGARAGCFSAVRYIVKDLDIPGGERWIDSDRRLRAVYDGVALGIVVVDLSNRILDGNRAFYALLGYRPGGLRLRRFDDLSYPSDAVAQRSLVDDLLAGRRDAFTVDVRLLRQDDTTLWARLTSSLVHDSAQTTRYRVIAVEDVSARVALDAEDKAQRDALKEQLRRAQRLETVGRFAGTIAHDFNNLLTVVRSNAEFIARGDGAARAEIVSYADDIRQSADRASSLTRQLLAFCRRQPAYPQAIDLNDALRDMEQLLTRLVGEDVGVGLRLMSGRSVVCTDPTRLQQIVLNIAVNAREEMPRGGSFIVETAEDSGTQSGVCTGAPQHGSRRRYVRLSLSHNGASIPDDVQPYLFDPLFDGAARGAGAALGLPTIRSIVAESGGFIRVRSSLGHGTTFDICFPAHEAATSAAATEVATGDDDLDRAAPDADEGCGTETILLVEDDAAVRQVTRRALEGMGYTMLVAENGADAIRLAAAYPGEIHLILTDVVMPGVSGPASVDRITMARPNVPAIYISGYADDILEEHGVIERVRRFVRKPFTPRELTRVIRDVLD